MIGSIRTRFSTGALAGLILAAVSVPQTALAQVEEVTVTAERREAALQDVPAYLIDTENDIDPAWLESKRVIGLTAGASAPEILVQNVINRLIELGVTEVETLSGKAENVAFSLPKALQQA